MVSLRIYTIKLAPFTTLFLKKESQIFPSSNLIQPVHEKKVHSVGVYFSLSKQVLKHRPENTQVLFVVKITNLGLC